MENHPVPQNISSYEFRLVGDMTLKQFLQLAGGIVVGVIIFRLQIIAIIKYPLSALSVIIGVLMAFVPINGRPFTTWLVAFFKAIYSPTEFVWIPEQIIASALPAAIPPQTAPVISQPAKPTSPVAAQTPTATTAPASPPSSPSKVSPLPSNSQVKASSHLFPSFSDFLNSKLHKKTTSAHKETTFSKVESVPVAPVSPPVNSTPAPQKMPIVPPTAPPQVVPRELPKEPSPPPSTITGNSTPVFAAAAQLPKTAAVPSAPSATTTNMISSPTSPNILSGLVTDPQNQPLPQITIEIIDVSTGIPARALRTNKLGQFQIAIPLPPGTYNVIAEKDGLRFDPQSIQVKGNIVPPVIIQGKPA